MINSRRSFELRRLSRACFAVANDLRRDLVILGLGSGNCALARVRDRMGSKSMYTPFACSRVLSADMIWKENDDIPVGQGTPVGHEDSEGMADILVVAACALESEAEDMA